MSSASEEKNILNAGSLGRQTIITKLNSSGEGTESP